MSSFINKSFLILATVVLAVSGFTTQLSAQLVYDITAPATLPFNFTFGQMPALTGSGNIVTAMWFGNFLFTATQNNPVAAGDTIVLKMELTPPTQTASNGTIIFVSILSGPAGIMITSTGTVDYTNPNNTSVVVNSFFNVTYTAEAAAVPEPSTYLTLGGCLGLIALAAAKRRKVSV